MTELDAVSARRSPDERRDDEMHNRDAARRHPLVRLRAHVPLAVVLGAGIALRALVVVAYQPALLLQRDTYAYLRLALETEPSGLRPVLYPLLIRPLVATGELAAVPVVQHLLGIAGALLLYFMLIRLGSSHLVAALGVAPALLDGYIIAIEHFVLAEAAFTFAVIAGLVLLVRGDRPRLGTVVAAGLLLGIAPTLRFVGVAVLPVAVLYLLVRRAGVRVVLAFALAAVVPVAAYLQWARSTADDLESRQRDGLILYGRVVEFADCRAVEVPPEERFLCPNPDRPQSDTKGVWTSGLPVRRVLEQPDANERLRSFAWRMIAAMPGEYVRAVLGDFVRFFEPEAPVDQEPNAVRWTFVRNLSEARPHPLVARYGGAPPPELGFEADFRIDRGTASVLRAYQSVVHLWGPLLLLALVLALAGAAFGDGGRTHSPRAEALMFSLSAVALLLLPTAIAVYHFRYVLPAIPLAGAAAALGFTALRRRPVRE